MKTYRMGLVTVAAAAAGLAVVIASQAGAAGNPVEERQGLMKQQGQVMKEAGAFLAPNAAFDAAKAKTLMATLSTSADKLHKLYPADSKDAPKTEALPKIWENKADFDKRLTELSKLAKDAGGATSADAFKPAYMAIGKACKDCHDQYRAKKS
jgi:cytochrome c556